MAMKILKNGNCANLVRKSKIRREVHILRLLNHPNIYKLRDILKDPDTNTYCLVTPLSRH